MKINDRAKQIAVLLIAQRYLPRREIKDMLLDEELYNEVNRILNAVGLEIVTHIYSDYVSVKVVKDMEETVFASEDKNKYTASNANLSRGARALLVVIWAKIILPKRQMQIERRSPEENGQDNLWQQSRAISRSDSLIVLDERSLFSDFGEVLGGKTMFGKYLSELARADLIVRRADKIYEGPLLDTIIDYNQLSERIINGILNSIFEKNQFKVTTEEEKKEGDV